MENLRRRFRPRLLPKDPRPTLVRLTEFIDDPFYTLKEAKELCGLSQSRLRSEVGWSLTVWFLAPDGTPPAKPRLWVRLSQLEAWLRNRLYRH